MLIPAMLFVALRLGTVQPACANFAGNYVIAGQDGRVHVSIQQKACTSVQVVWSSSKIPNSANIVHTVRLDGAYRPDNAWFGATEQQTTSATLRGKVLEIKEKPASAGAADPVAWTLRLEKLTNADLCTRFTQGSINISSLAAKQTVVSLAGEDEAAKRSGSGCPGR